MTYQRKEVIGDCTLYLGNCMEVMPKLGRVSHVISDPPYEAILHAAKVKDSKLRKDTGPELKAINFSSIDSIRSMFVGAVEDLCDGWLIAFCTVEGVAKWADEINPRRMKYKRACIWVKPDSTPQLNGQGPAQGAECFVVAWNGKGHAKWNAGGKRGVYTCNTNGGGRTGLHPTEKPVRLMQEILTDFTNSQEVILDPFMGSGTTLVACAKMGRSGIGIELDPEYFEIACKRVEEAYRQPDMFVQRAPEPLQETLI